MSSKRRRRSRKRKSGKGWAVSLCFFLIIIAFAAVRGNDGDDAAQERSASASRSSGDSETAEPFKGNSFHVAGLDENKNTGKDTSGEGNLGEDTPDAADYSGQKGPESDDFSATTQDSSGKGEVSTAQNAGTVAQAQDQENAESDASTSEKVDLSDIPAYTGTPYVAVNDNVPYFSASDLTTTPFETYSELDSLGRCGTAYANVCQEIMPTEKRGNIGSVKPTGWHTVKYDNVDGKYLYNRCHLIGYQLSGENANRENLITGTRYLNVDGMLPFENMVADYVKETDQHVLYRVTPVFEGNNLLASGVLMEAESVEDQGDGVEFCVYCYNVQPGITINYADGTSELAS